MADVTDQSNLLSMQYTILGALMHNPKAVGSALTKLSADDFTTTGTRGLFLGLEALHNSGAPIEFAAIRQYLGEEYDVVLEEAWKRDTADVCWYIENLQQWSRIAAMHAFAYQIAASEDPEEIQGHIDALNAVSVHQKKTRVFSAFDMAELMLAELDPDQNTVYFRSGIREMDDEVDVEPGHFVILGGYPSAGKTALSLQMALNMAKTYRVGYFSLETDEKRAARRFLASLASIPMPAIRKKNFNDEQHVAAAEAASYFSALHIDFIPASSMQVRDIQALSLANRYQVVFVDYLQIIPEQGGSRFEVVTNISQALHRMAQQTRIAVFALAQLTRSKDQTGKPQPPNMHSLRESGQIEQDADIIMLLYQTNPDDYTSPRFLKVAKNKDGPKVKLTLNFDGKTQRFSVSRDEQLKNMARKKPRPTPVLSAGAECVQLDMNGNYPLAEDQLEDIPF